MGLMIIHHVVDLEKDLSWLKDSKYNFFSFAIIVINITVSRGIILVQFDDISLFNRRQFTAERKEGNYF